MLETPSFAAIGPKTELSPFVIKRREPGPHDALIDIDYCGVCHSDIHQIRNEWGDAIFPMVPGHEIVGRVSRVGSSVKRWKPGDAVGVGVFVDSCRKCRRCLSGEEQYCEKSVSFTYNSREQDGRSPTYGGYSTRITVNENYILRIPDEIAPQRAAPLLCAGITTYSPIRHFRVKQGDKLAIVGLGGLGHMAVKFGRALGAEVTVVSHSPSKRADALRLGATEFISSRDPSSLKSSARQFDFVLNTASTIRDYDTYLDLLRTDGTMILVGLPQPTFIRPQSLADRRLRMVGSSVGGIHEIQEMLDFANDHELGADVEMIRIQDINQAFEKVISGDVRYRFVIDIESLRDAA